MQDPLCYIGFRASKSYGKARCEPGWNWRPPPLADYDLWYVVAGSGTIKIGEERYGVSKGCCVLARPGDMPEADQDQEDRLTVIYIHFEALESGEPNKSVPLPIARMTVVPEPALFESRLNRMLETLELRDAYVAGEFECLLRLALYELLRHQGGEQGSEGVSAKQRQTVARVSALIRAKAEGRMTVGEAAEMAGLSAEYLSLLFKKATGVPLQSFLTKVRMERAMLLLTETSMNVSQIADALGYENVFMFSRQFKRHFGSAPSAFHRKAVSARPHGPQGPEHISGKG